MLRPSSSTRPSARPNGTVSCSRLRQRRNVDLPHPDGPMMAVTSRSRSAIETSRMAADAPKYADRLSVSSRGRPRAASRRSVGGAARELGSGCKEGNDTDDEDHGDEDEC